MAEILSIVLLASGFTTRHESDMSDIDFSIVYV